MSGAARFPPGAVLAAVVIHTLWGANPVAVKWGLEVFGPLTSGFVRFTIGAAAVAAWALARRMPLMPPREEWRPLAVVTVLFAVQIWLMNVGYGLTSGSLGAILIALNPLFAAGFAHFLFPGDRLTTVRAAGLVVAFAGTALVLASRGETGVSGFANAGNWILLLSAALLGGRLIASAHIIRRVDETRATLWMMVLSLPLFGLTAFASESIAWHNLGWRPVAGIAYQGLVIAGLAFMVNSYLMRLHSPTTVASFNFVSPAAGVLLSLWLLDESVSAALLAGLLGVAAGLVLITRPRRAAS